MAAFISMLGLVWLMVIAAPAVAAQNYPYKDLGYQVTQYSFVVKLPKTGKTISVRDTPTIQFSRNGVKEVALDLCQYRNKDRPRDKSNPCLPQRPFGSPTSKHVPSAAGTGMTVTSVTSASGNTLTYSQRDDKLIVHLRRPSRVVEVVRFTASYHGVPAGGLIIGKNRHGVRGFYVNEWPNRAHDWLATIDRLAMKAAITMSVVAPPKYQVISNGTKIEQVNLSDGLMRTVWQEKVPICTWQIALAAAPMAIDHFGKFDGIPLSAAVFPKERKVGFTAFSTYTKPILAFYISHIGPFSWAKLTQVQANGTFGGMELASDIFYGYPESGPGMRLIAHEMAHQWFGDSLTEDNFNNVWLSEGFASYFSLLHIKHADGRTAFLKSLESGAAVARKYYEAHPKSTLVGHLKYAGQVLYNAPQIYRGGAQTLQMLRGTLGTRTFWNGIRLYYERNQNGVVNDADLKRAMQDACRRDKAALLGGRPCPEYGRNLTWFFQEWLHLGGVMKVSGHWRYDSAAHQLVVSVDQVPDQGKYRKMPFQVKVVEPKAQHTKSGRGHRHARRRSPAVPLPVIMVKGPHTVLRLSIAHAPISVSLDPNHFVTLAVKHFGRAGS